MAPRCRIHADSLIGLSVRFWWAVGHLCFSGDPSQVHTQRRWGEMSGECSGAGALGLEGHVSVVWVVRRGAMSSLRWVGRAMGDRSMRMQPLVSVEALRIDRPDR